MTHTEILTREDGTKYKIKVFLLSRENQHYYYTMHSVMYPDSDQYRPLPRIDDNQITQEEIANAKMKLWEGLKP